MKTVILSILAGCTCLLIAAAAVAEQPEAVYSKGKQAYERDDHLRAVQYLFAYLEMTGPGLEAQTRSAIREALSYSEEHIEVALRTKRQLDEKGRVVEVVVESSGKADDMGPRYKQEPFRPPRTRVMRKPAIPSVEKAAAENTVQVKDIGKIHSYDLESTERRIPIGGKSPSADAAAPESRACNECERKYEDLQEKYAALKQRYLKLQYAVREMKSRIDRSGVE